MKVIGWILILTGLFIVVLKGIPTDSDTVRTHQPLSEVDEEKSLIGWQTLAGGVISIIGIIFIASCEKPK